MQIRPSSIQVRFLTQINRVGKKSYGYAERFSQSGLKRDFGDLTGRVEGSWMGQKSGVNREGQMLRFHLLAFRK
jgi:hypothetical protein